MKRKNYRYYDEHGNGLPSVTEILNLIPKPYLILWANKIGLKGEDYREISNIYTTIGTAVHNAIEDVLLERPIRQLTGIFQEAIDMAETSFNNFIDWYNDQESIEVVFIEKELICKDYAGTADALLKVNGENILIDFKTSNRISVDYPIQLAAYYNLIDERIDKLAVLRLSKMSNKYEFKIYSLDEIRNVYLPIFLKALELYKSLEEL